MARRQARTPDRERVVRPLRRLCPACGGAMRIRYENRRTLVTLSGTVRMHLKIRRCETKDCARYHRPYRPEVEGPWHSPSTSSAST
jgi:rRNA maturation protein Nop10